MDALSSVLRMVRLRACIYFVRDMPASWGMEVPGQSTGPFHLVLEGRCLLQHEEREIWLQAGDAVLFPHGAPHRMRDHPKAPLVPAAEIMPALMKGQPDTGGPPAVRMLCGHFERDRRFDHPILHELPQMLLVRNAFDSRHAPGLGGVVALLSQEAARGGPGAEVVAARMGEALFVLVLRSWLSDQIPGNGLLAAMADPRLSRALTHMHDHADEEIDLDGLARVAGMSRTSFAVRFREIAGTTPAAYLTGWRLMLARELLAGSDLPLASIAQRVGYGSDASFLRAYKRQFDHSPGAFRREIRSSTEMLGAGE